MPTFKFHLRHRQTIDKDDLGIDFADLDHAYLQACQTIPDTARDLLVDGLDPMACAFLICDGWGRTLMEIPFAEVLSASEQCLQQPLTKQSVASDGMAKAHAAELEMARRYVALARRHVAEQELRLAELHPGSAHFKIAQQLLDTFKASLHQHLLFRDLLRRKLEMDSAANY